MKKLICSIILVSCVFLSLASLGQTPKRNKIDLSGTWAFAVDSTDKGIKEQWYNHSLPESIHLPGSMTTNNKGDDVSLNTPWTGGLWNIDWYKDPSYAKYRELGNIKVSFWLQPVKHYVGVAWYKKTVEIPQDWSDKHLELFFERCHWETTLWIDGQKVGMENALGAPNCFQLNKSLKPGRHTIALRIDNRIKDINPGTDAHSVTDNTQTNWNGVIGEMSLLAKPRVYLSDVQLYPDVDKKLVQVRVKISNISGILNLSHLTFSVQGSGTASHLTLPVLQQAVNAGTDSTTVMFNYPMGNHPLLWDEFSPNLYRMKVTLNEKGGTDSRDITFGMRKFIPKGRQLTINDRPVFLRGTLECAIFPKTGFPPTDKAAWARIFRICRSYGLNHMRFHSWCPPEAAFEAADEAGFYLSIECSAWAKVGDSKPIDRFLYEESNHIVNAFGNHPSFCMMPYGNKPDGEHLKEYLTRFVKYWKQKDSRRLYTTASGWPIVPENDYNVSPDPRIQAWGGGVNSIINAEAPKTDYDWFSIINKWPQPTVSHEIGQWCVYPNFKEVKKYDGVLKPKNFEIFYDRLKEHHLENLADSFLYASGKLQVLCYKADIEAALRTKGFGGFQLLDLHDFPGQGTALVGVLDPFWDEKGYVTAQEYRQFCNSTVPLIRTHKLIYENNEQFEASVEIAHYGSAPLKHVTPVWQLLNSEGQVLFHGQLPTTDIAIGNCIQLGKINQSLSTIITPQKLLLKVEVGNYVNTWSVFVYPSKLPQPQSDIYVTQHLDEKAVALLNSGGKVLLTLKKGTIKDDKGGNVVVGFSSIFWNTSWTNNQPPHTLGILCDPKHPALAQFPTDYYSNWEWQDGMRHSNAIRLDSLSADIKPIVRVIDDWFTARPLGLIFECKVGNGSLLISGIDLLTNQENRPEARQLFYSLQSYMETPGFKPQISVQLDKINKLLK